jgi:hypothetical protein
MSTISNLNDKFRTTFTGGQVVMTPGIAAMPVIAQLFVQKRIQKFTDFKPDNDPNGEHDFGSLVTINGVHIFWKIDYYDRNDMDFGSPNPADERVTQRVLTIMLAEEY